ncbi:hypothetical protein [Legionella bononiensis]|uniref:Poly(A) polymerase I n=1 Tax=Legionella bononiensis TaxID=2793102 RepID=A0ABS1WAI4_9GAMM|nr:hypothetical protein [Legionella bononiensis]MBL7480414.1 hypothetical protein [Legionella bononiensis]MBL7526354.1 hypothetical protein [Legionella bononiensis]MBL7563153.1 hypothetical protein [Legionella bononiensis]
MFGFLSQVINYFGTLFNYYFGSRNEVVNHNVSSMEHMTTGQTESVNSDISTGKAKPQATSHTEGALTARAKQKTAPVIQQSSKGHAGTQSISAAESVSKTKAKTKNKKTTKPASRSAVVNLSVLSEHSITEHDSKQGSGTKNISGAHANPETTQVAHPVDKLSAQHDTTLLLKPIVKLTPVQKITPVIESVPLTECQTIEQQKPLSAEQAVVTTYSTDIAAAKSASLMSQSPAFFVPLSQRAALNVQYLNRNQFPLPMMQLLDELRTQFPEARFFLTGAATSNILDGIKPNDYDILIINISMSLVNDFLHSRQLYTEIRSTKYPIIFCDMGNGITLDFTVNENQLKESVQHLLNADFEKRDFNLNALYCEITTEINFLIFSFGNAMNLRNKKIISSIKEPGSAFEHDPVRIFRLAKLLITNPTYVLSKDLQVEIKSFSQISDEMPKWKKLIKTAIREDYGTLDRIDYAMRKLFIRYGYEDINKAFYKLGLLTEFTDNSYSSVRSACSKVPAIEADEKFIYWIMANILQRFENGKSNQTCPLNFLLRLSFIEQDYLDYVYGKGPNKIPEVYVFVPEVLALIKQFRLSYEFIETDALVANASFTK